MTQAYLSGPIINIEDRKDDFYTLVVNILNQMNVRVFSPQFLPPAPAKEIYERDVEWVRSSDFIIAEVSRPSHGVGMEIMLAIELGKPIVMFRDRSSKGLSKMVLGATGKVLFEYDEPSQVERILKSISFRSVQIGECKSCTSQVLDEKDSKLRCVLCGTLN